MSEGFNRLPKITGRIKSLQFSEEEFYKVVNQDIIITNLSDWGADYIEKLKAN